MMLRVLYLLTLCSVFPLTVSATPLPFPEHGPALRIQGSNTIGAALGPALVRGLLEQQGLKAVHSETPARPNEERLVGTSPQGKRVLVEIAAFQHRLCRAETGRGRPGGRVTPDQGPRTGGPRAPG